MTMNEKYFVSWPKISCLGPGSGLAPDGGAEIGASFGSQQTFLIKGLLCHIDNMA